ncbi:Hypothetical protein SCLAV_2141 [Streptomyces clavuligerus]|uniref:Uncharacterized protein n=1 Tax=Streptomyces clavuligerus TaxID=1901 RepID=B5GXV9_STRCL|nr:hypothetical protein SSCG_04183 [Streptomyces clavuligerus]EFG07214.1 Hypothetical protein SCLAV_2141 [Streptomyces clavuligerus]
MNKLRSWAVAIGMAVAYAATAVLLVALARNSP